MKNINDYFIARPKLTLALVWIFTAIAVGIGVVLNVWFMQIGYFQFLAAVAIPVILAIYFRLMYGKVQDQRRREREAQGKLANQTRYGHNKKKKKR